MKSSISRVLIAALVAFGSSLLSASPAQANCGTGTGTQLDPVIVDSESELRAIGSSACQSSSTTKYYKLGANIHLTATWVPITLSSSRGVHLDGDGFQISGLQISTAASAAALFNSSTVSGSVKNVSIIGSSIEYTGASQNAYAAAVIGAATQPWTIENVHVVLGSISSATGAAGLAGSLTGAGTEIRDSSVRVLSSISGGSATAQLSGAVGYLKGTLSNVQVWADIDGSASTDSEAVFAGIAARTINSAGFTRVADSSYIGSIVGNGGINSSIGGVIGIHSSVYPSTNTTYIERSSVIADISGGKYMGGLLGQVADANNSVDVYIDDSKYQGVISSNVAGVNPWMGGIVGQFRDYNPGLETIRLSRNFASVKFQGTGTTDFGALYTEVTSGTRISASQLIDNVYESSALANSTYSPGSLQSNGSLTVADIKPMTLAELQDAANYPASFNIRTSATSPDFGTVPRNDVWGICTHPDSAATAAAAAAGFETTAFLLSEVRRCGELQVVTMDVYPTQTAVAGTPIASVFPNSTSVTSLQGMLAGYYSVSPNLPAGLSIHPRTGKLIGTPATVDGTTYTLTSTNLVSSRTATFRLMLDTNPPLIVSTSPANGATGVSPTTSIIFNLDENVTAAAGKIRIRKSSDNSVVLETDPSDQQVAISGSQLTLSPSVSLPEGTSLTLEITAGALLDGSNNSFAGLASGAITFTTSDVTAPILLSSDPPHNGTVPPGLSEISMVFSEAITLGNATSGQLALYLASDNSLVEDFDISDANVVSVAGSTVTLAVSVSLVDGESYYVTAPSTAFEDAASNAFAGLAQNALVFSVAAATSSPAAFTGPIISSVNPNPAQPGQPVVLSGSNLSGIRSVTVDGQSIAVAASSTSVSLVLPANVRPGTWDIVLSGDFGTLTVQEAITITDQFEQITTESTSSFWTKRIGNSVKVYAKNIVGAGKVQFMHEGREFAWVRANDETDRKLREANGSYYLVRTYELKPGKNAFEIYLDGERVWRAAYTLR